MGQPHGKELHKKGKGEPKISKEEEERLRIINAESQKLLQLTEYSENFVASLSKDEKGVILTRKGLKKVPAPMFLLVNVTLLDLSFNRLQSLPQELGTLEQLIHLNVSHNHIQYRAEKDYPETELSVITKFTKLQFLDISWNNVPTIRFIKDIAPTVSHLDIHHNMQISVVPDLSHLHNLSYFDASECFITQLPNLESLPLKVVRASYTLGLKQLPRLPTSLVHLHVSEKVEKIGIDFGHCTNLITLDMRNNMLKNQDEFNGAGLQTLTSLSTLMIGPSQMEAFPEVVCSIPSLTALEYGGMKNLRTLPAGLSALTNLQRIVLRWNELSEFPAVLLSISRLSFLDISGNGLVEIPPQITQLSELQHLNLTYNKLKLIPQELGQITTLRELYIDENPIEDPQLAELAKIGNQKNLLAYIRTGEVHQDLEALLEHSGFTIPPSYKKVTPSPKIAIPEGASKLSKEQLCDKIRGTIFGAAVGDAVGLATEFLNKEQSSFIYGRAPISFSQDAFPRDRHRGRWLTGDWTDDTDQLILIMENLIDGQGDLDIKAFALSLIKWAYAGFSELGDDGGMGIGQTVGKVLSNKAFLDDPHAAALHEWEQSGRKVAPNGAVMRTGILGIPNFDNLDKVVDNTLAICKVTHADPRCLASCVAVTTSIALMLQGEQDTTEIIKRAEEIGLRFLSDEAHIAEFKQHMHAHVKDLDLSDRPKIGYTFKSLGSGFYALRETDFEKAIMKVTWEAGDADTNAAVAGALLGCKLGLSHLPPRWINSLVHKDWLHRKVNSLLELMGLE